MILLVRCMKNLWNLKKEDIKNLKKEFYNTGYGKYLLIDIIGGFCSIVLLMLLSSIFYGFDKNISLIFIVFSFIIAFFVILEYFRVEYILFEKFLLDRNKKK